MPMHGHHVFLTCLRNILPLQTQKEIQSRLFSGDQRREENLQQAEVVINELETRVEGRWG